MTEDDKPLAACPCVVTAQSCWLVFLGYCCPTTVRQHIVLVQWAILQGSTLVMHTTTAAATDWRNLKHMYTEALFNAVTAYVLYIQSSLRHYLYIATPAKQTLNRGEHCATNPTHHTYFIERLLKDTLGVIEATLCHVARRLPVQQQRGRRKLVTHLLEDVVRFL